MLRERRESLRRARLVLFVVSLGSFHVAYGTQCVFHSEASRFQAASKVYLARIVEESTYRSPFAIKHDKPEADVIRHHLKVLSVFRGDVPQRLVLTSKVSNSPYGIHHGGWKPDMVGETWIIIGGRGQCSGSYRVDSGDIASVIERFEEYARHAGQPWNHPGLAQLHEAAHLADIGHHPEAIAILEARIADTPDDAVAYRMLGDTYREWGDSAMAEAVFARLLEAVPPIAYGLPGHQVESFNGLMGLARLKEQSGDLNTAAELLEHGADLYPTYSQITSDLVRVLRKLGRYDEAERTAERMFERFCVNDYDGCERFAHAQVGRIYVQMGLSAKAADHLLSGLDVEHPSHHELKEALAAASRAGQLPIALVRAREFRDAAYRHGVGPEMLESLDDAMASFE